MMKSLRAAVVIAVLVPVAGCSIYFGDDTGDDCQGAIEGDTAYPGPGYRNPETGTCEAWGGGGCYDSGGGAQAEPDWAVCDGSCEALDEVSCLAAAECRAAYLGWTCPPWADSEADCLPSMNEFLGCWGIAPSGPAEPEDCWSLDAYACSRHNDCSAVYQQVEAPGDDGGFQQTLSFVGCQPEAPVQGCYSDEECPSGYECTADTECTPPPGCDPDTGMCDSDSPQPCYGQCVPSTSSCAAVDCGPGYHCEEECWPCDDADGDGMCEPLCQPTCVPDYNTCTAIDCGPGYECQELCWPCDPLPDGTGCEDGPYCEPQCVRIGPQTCDDIDCGVGGHCEIQCWGDPDGGTMDECQAVCVPDSGCAAVDCGPGYHCEETCEGACTPDGECPPPVCTIACVPDMPTDTCEALASEDACLARPDCTAVYQGENCECTPFGGCTCEILTYERCETGWIGEPPPGAIGRRRITASSALH